MPEYYESNSNICLGKNLANSLGLLLESQNVIHWSCHQNCPLSVFFQFFTFVAFLAEKGEEVDAIHKSFRPGEIVYHCA